MATYQWPLPVGQADPDPEQAALAPDTGVQNVNGTSHDIPGVANGCVNCHGKLSERVLGFGAIQLSHSLGGLTFTELADRGVISSAPLRGGYHPPGDATAQAALGYLHVNCGNCHNETGQATNNPPATESLWLRLLVGQTTVAMTHAQTTAINRMTGNPNFVMDRIEPMQPAQSSMIVRMERNPTIGETLQMPPVARELPDPTGIGLVTDWVNALAP
jgi:cytochrome c553